MGRDIHSKPFDEGTQLKLLLYQYYISEWLPVFLHRQSYLYKTINIFDYFAGPGQDHQGTKGSPLITIKAIQPYLNDIEKNKLDVNLYFNELNKIKLEKLKALLSLEEKSNPFQIHFSNDEFQKAFEMSYSFISSKNSANFVFLDQYGIKEITDTIFKKIISASTTDFMFFISSSTINRFYDHPEIKKYIEIPKSKITVSKYLHIHRVILEYYRQLIPSNKEYYLAPFSIKKGANIYGLVFGSSNLLGIEKFLRSCWKIDPERGEANFDIDEDDIDRNQPFLFAEMNVPRKTLKFEEMLSSKILDRSLKTNRQIYIYALTNGFLPKHARDLINKLVKDKHLPKQKLKISYQSCRTAPNEQKITFF